MNIYIAGKWEAKERLKAWRTVIENSNLGTVVGTWLNEEGKPGDQVSEREAWEYANRDLDEINAADLLILDTEDTNERGGREVEFGFALAKCPHVWVVGPKRNVFHRLANRHHMTWEETIRTLRVEADRGNR